jgi:trans-aconitate methyltransferase
LCDRVGERGAVVATELDTRFVEALDCPNLEVLRHDVAVDDLPDRHFDLIHERAVLLHVPSREEVLKRLVAALRPGGWLLCEDTDFSTFVYGSPTESLRKAAAAMIRFLRSTGAEPNYGRHLLQDCGRST